MYIQEISIDGFKSYAQRVTLPNFDSAFNAITGLNGSGKSNILDSICFVLGITNLQHVRAQSLQDLVYKQGNAGVTKATVSITFHNNDPRNGPAGYEDKEYITITRQIVIGGRNKYLINGHAANPSRVQDLFHSVQLNVNNPHFLIMQGRVTKVLNMKPPEILSLLEEASGTRLYEKKKDNALKTLDKKQTKLSEIDQVINVELRPALQKLEKDCAQYHEYAVLSQNLERLKRFCIAYDYWTSSRNLVHGESDIQLMQRGLAELDEKRKALEADVQDKESDMRALQTEKEIQSSGEMKELQKEADELNMRLTKETTNWKNKKDTLHAEKQALKQIVNNLEELKDEGFQRRVEEATARRDEARAAEEQGEHLVEAASRELAGVEAGDGRDESNRSLQERLADAVNAQTAADAEAKQAEIQTKHLDKQLAELRKQLASKEKEATSSQKELQKAEKAVQDGEAKLQGLDFNEEAMRQLEATVEAERVEVRRCRDQVEELSSQLAHVDFSYRDPERGFDRSKVKGVVAKLIHVKDLANSLALEVTAGGKLYQVVVDSEKTGQALLDKGQLARRVTIIPLNKVRYHELPSGVMAAAKKLSDSKSTPAIELVGCDQEVETAMKYVFGTAFVCQDSGTAKKLAFSKEVSSRCVTLDGDDFNPGGLLTGGSRNTSSPVLARLHALREAEGRLNEHHRLLEEAEKGIRAQTATAREYKKLQQSLELTRHSLTLLKERIANSESAQLAESVANCEKELAEAKEAAKAAQTRKGEMVALAKSLEKEIADFSKDRDKRVKTAKEKLKKAKQELEARKKLLKQKEQALQAALAEQEAAIVERQSLEDRRTGGETTVATLEKEVEELQNQVAATKAAHGAAAQRLKVIRARIQECDAELSRTQKEKDALVEQMQELDVEKKRTENKIQGKRSDLTSAKDKMERLEKDYDWINREKQNFGHGDFDFDNSDPVKVYKEYEACQKKFDSLKEKGINKNADSMLRKNHEELESLMTKRQQLEKDKNQIMQVIGELDEKKRVALQATWVKVNEDFGKIFSTLLPGTQAKLEPPENETFLEGLEVRVAFGDVWKESLTELSGGQRSLIALSLILALCRFKPAPIYILDEVDAALDLNHTQNIGRMIKEHFPESQFIVVSLKEGMFNNANVIFRTKFVDGVSTVTRTVNDTRDMGHAASKHGPQEAHKQRRALAVRN